MKPVVVKSDKVRDNKAKARALVGAVPAKKVIVPKTKREPKYRPDFTEDA